jgi:hypothetical protein
MIKHAKQCWGNDAWVAAERCRDVAEVRSKVTGPIALSGSIAESFKRKGNGTVQYSHRMQTKTEIKSVTIFKGFSDNQHAVT